MIEQWRDIVGFEGHYQVSTLGNVRRFFRSGYKKLNVTHNKVKLYIIGDEGGYYRVDHLMRGAFPRGDGKKMLGVVVFDINGKLVGGYQSLKSFKRYVLEQEVNTGSYQYNILKAGEVLKQNDYFIMLDKYYDYKKIKTSIKEFHKTQNKKITDKEVKVLKTSTKRTVEGVMIFDGDFNFKKLHIGSIVDLAKKEGILWGTLKSKVSKDKKIFTRILAGGDLIPKTSSPKRYLHLRDYVEISDKYLDKSK